MNATPQVLWENEWTIASDTQVGRGVIDEILRELDQHGWEAGQLFGIHLALEEGVTNAIRHGNCRDPHKQVRISCHLTAERVRLEIEDEGPGFDPSRVPDCTCLENLEKPGGRGLYLIQNYMDLVEYTGRGNQLVLEKAWRRRSDK